MDKLTELMIITMEECGELTQACSKLLRVRDRTGKVEPEMLEQLTQEAADVRAMIWLMHEHKLLSTDSVEKGMDIKLKKLEKWSNLI
jgi:NTP pyrophosphatase (non-canonical NTP hydrolase)